MTAKHSNLGPSSAKRWMNCPGSVAATADTLPQPPSKFAAEGTVAHDLAERLVTGKITDHALMGRVGDIQEQEGFDIEITEEMVNAVILYRDFIVAETKAMTLSKGSTPVVGKAEVRVKATSIDSALYGTADYLLYKKGSALRVFDFKYGQGVAVDPEENEQMGIYAVAAMDSEAGSAFSVVELVIVQPRAGGDPVRRWVANRGTWIADFRDTLKAAVKATRVPNAPRAAGEWCRWCAAKSICATAAAEVQKQAMVDFSRPAPAKTTALPDISNLTLAQMTQALEWESHISGWFDAVKVHIRALLDSGQEVPGYKLVEGKSNRKWIDENKVIEELEPLFGRAGLFESKLLSPAKLEKLVGKGNLDHLTFKPEGNKAIAKESDARPAAKNSAAVDFAPIESPKMEHDALDELLGVTPKKKLWA